MQWTLYTILRDKHEEENDQYLCKLSKYLDFEMPYSCSGAIMFIFECET